MNLSRRPPPDDAAPALPMTSMIDVVFLLLIFFLVTSSFTPPESRLSASPAAEGQGAPSDLAPQVIDVIVIAGVDTFVLADHTTTDPLELVALLEPLPREPGVAVRVADDARVASAAAALQAAADAGFETRSYVPRTR